MNRRFNFTGRKRLTREHARVSLSSVQDSAPRFVAELSLDDLGLPPDAEVIVEAYRQMSLQRFEWGTLGQLRAPQDTTLSEFNDPAGVLFRVKVVGTGEAKGRLLAEADRIRPVEPEGDGGTKRPLLPVAAEKLDGEVWRLGLETDDPVLFIEKSLGDPVAIARTPAFAGLVYPAVIRIILGRITASDDYDPEEPTGWHSDWLKFAKQICGLAAPAPGDSFEQKSDWADSVARDFCRRHDLVSRLASQWEEESK